MDNATAQKIKELKNTIALCIEDNKKLKAKKIELEGNIFPVHNEITKIDNQITLNKNAINLAKDKLKKLGA